jgi:hypothetical protein
MSWLWHRPATGSPCICMSSSELHTLQRAFATAGGKSSTFVIWAKNTFSLAARPGPPEACHLRRTAA